MENKKIGGKKMIKPERAEGLPPLLKNSAIHRKYGLTSVIAEDFAGTLYGTAKKSGGKEVAVKVLKSGYALVSNTLGNIEHSRICQVLHTIIEHDKIQAVVFEKPEGIPLSEMIRKSGPLTPGQTVSAGLQLLSALHAVHWTDAYVGNLHSDSIYLFRDKRDNLELQLTNLGVGCIQDKLRETDYLAPEQIMGGKGGGAGSDIWAVGVIMYEMLFGKRPFHGENRYAVAGEILLQEPDFSKKPRGVPDDLIAFIRKSMQKDESDRYKDVAQMVSELLPFQSEFNEPMSLAARSAIRDSKPPLSSMYREKTAAKTAARTSAAAPKARVIPTVRISHTPSEPPSGLTQQPGRLHGRSGKQTKLGMPAISLPAKRIPLKSNDDTSTFPAQKSSDPQATALLSNPPDKAAGEFPRPAEIAASKSGRAITERAFSVVTKTLTGLRATLAEAGAKMTGKFPKLLAKTPKPAELKAGFVSLSPKLKALVIGSGGLFVTLLVLLIAVAGGDGDAGTGETSATALEKKNAAEIAAYEARLASMSTAVPDVEPTAPPKAAVPEIPPNKEVTISLEGKLPRRARIRVDGKLVKAPIVLKASSTPASVSVTARGYASFTQTVVPTEDLTIEVQMDRVFRGKGGANWRRGGRAPKKNKKNKKQAKSGDDLASNPF